MTTTKAGYQFERLRIASQAPLDRLAQSDGAAIQTALKTIASKQTYSTSEAQTAVRVLDGIEGRLREIMNARALVSCDLGYTALDNVYGAAQEARNVLNDVLHDGLLGFSKGNVSPLALQLDINAELPTVNAILGGELAREFQLGSEAPWVDVLRAKGDTPTPESLARFAELAEAMLKSIGARVAASQLSAEQRFLIDTFMHTLERASACASASGTSPDVAFVNPLVVGANATLSTQARAGRHSRRRPQQ